MKEVNPKETTRAYAFEMWIDAPMPMLTFFKTIDVTPPYPDKQTDWIKVQYADVLVHRTGSTPYQRVLYASGR